MSPVERLALPLIWLLAGVPAQGPVRMPADGAVGVNPDAHLVLTFERPPTLGASGQIRIYDSSDHRLVDTLDFAIAPGPRPGGAQASPAPAPYQLTEIGGFKEGFHFYPVIVHDRVATIYPHQHALAYHKKYEVQVDPGVLMANGFAGITGWTFTTKAAPPSPTVDRLVVAADGSGDFNTVQGAVDAVPDAHARRVTVFIRSGTYEEIVYFRNKTNITFLGEDRDAVVIGYANNETFNGPPPGVPTNEKPATFPYRRASFMADHSSGIHLVNLSLRNFTPRGGGQAEALLLMGGQNIVTHVSLYGHQDTLQFNDSVYLADSDVEGDTDFLWGRGPAFFENCVIRQLTNSPFMWVRSTSASHGFVFRKCRFETLNAGSPGPYLARNTAGYPDSEVVLIECALGTIHPAAWSLAGDTTNMHYWEYASTTLNNGQPADVHDRHPASRQLTMARDAPTIASYSSPAYVLGGWTPAMAPIILRQPTMVTVKAGEPVTLEAAFAAVPAATYQWRRNGVPIAAAAGRSGATTPRLELGRTQAAQAGRYTVTATNPSGTATSRPVMITVR